MYEPSYRWLRHLNLKCSDKAAASDAQPESLFSTV